MLTTYWKLGIVNMLRFHKRKKKSSDFGAFVSSQEPCEVTCTPVFRVTKYTKNIKTCQNKIPSSQ